MVICNVSRCLHLLKTSHFLATNTSDGERRTCNGNIKYSYISIGLHHQTTITYALRLLIFSNCSTIVSLSLNSANWATVGPV